MRWGEMAISAGMAVLATLFFVLANFTQNINPVDPGPAFYPRIVSLLLLIASLAQMVSTWRARPRDAGALRRTARRSRDASRYVLGTLFLSGAYVGLFDMLPYLVGAAAFLLALMWLSGVRRWLVLCGSALGYALVTYYVFGQILMVPLP